MNRNDEIQLADLRAMREASRLYKPNVSQNPLRQALEPLGKGLKRFCVGLLGRIKR